jgi:hypothetical protein
LAAGGVTVKLIAGSHANIFLEPNVCELGRQLSDALADTNLVPRGEQIAPRA